MVLSVLIEEGADLVHLQVHVTAVLTTKQAIERLELIERDNTVVIQVTGHEDLIDVLHLLSLQLI